METDSTTVNPIKRDLRKLLGVIVLVVVLFGVVQYFAVTTSYISDISHNIYKATLENS